MDLYYAATATYEGYVDVPQFRISDDPVVVLGRQFSTKYDLPELEDDIKSRYWFTYRKGFTPIGGSSGPTSDAGWGCMLRCGQMMLAHALLLRHMGRHFTWKEEKVSGDYLRILKMFQDKRTVTYSIHQIASMGVVEGKEIGQWHGPNTIAQVLRKLCGFDGWSAMNIHVAMDSMLIIDDICDECRSGQQQDSVWSPVLIIVPLRLGLTDVSSVYYSSLKASLSLPGSCGIIGGRPNHAHWFIGYVGDNLLYLDPHTNQQVVDVDAGESTSSYHSPTAGQMPFSALDPSVALGYFCATEQDLTQLCVQLRKHVASKRDPSAAPLFEVQQSRPRGYFGLHPEERATTSVSKDSDSDDDFVLL